MRSGKQNQYFIKYESVLKSYNKGQKLYLYFGQLDNIPENILCNYDKSKIIVEGQKRVVYLYAQNTTTVLEDGFQSLNVLNNLPHIKKVKVEIDQFCDVENPQFLSLLDKVIGRIQFKPQCKLHIVWNDFGDNTQMLEITKRFKMKVQINKMKFKVGNDYEQIIKCIEDNKDTLMHLSFEFLASVYRREDPSMETLFAQTISTLTQLEKLSLYCEGECSFIFMANCFSRLMMKDLEDERIEQSENNDERFPIQFKLKEFNFNVECIDFIPGYTFLISFLPQLLFSNPITKFRMKFPYETQFHDLENAFKMSDLLETYAFLFQNCTQISEFTFSTAGNTFYKDKSFIIEEGQEFVSSQTIIKPLRSILKKKSAIFTGKFGKPQIDPYICLDFIQNQKNLRKLTLKFDNETEIRQLIKLIKVHFSSLVKLNIRIRNNHYTKEKLIPLIEKINELSQLQELTLDVQLVEYFFYKLDPQKLTKLVKYKQGRMVKRSTDYTVWNNFTNDPVKLLKFFYQFKNLTTFQGQYPGFEYCKNYDQYYSDPTKYSMCIQSSECCEKLFKELYLNKKRLIRLILILKQYFMKPDILELLNTYYAQ